MDLALCLSRLDIRAVNRFHAILIVLALWAAIFLPGLGSSELKGEEGRRILPAATMLETGNWLVPYVSGKPFLRKPPLVNWAIAGAFKLYGTRNEWSARLPSVLSMLILALAIVAVSGKGEWMNVETALVAAILLLTQVATLDKGRLAEIEAIYTALSGLAMLTWLAWWTERRSPWLVWTVPFIFLGLAMLAKGPMHLLFFYAIVICVAWKAREWKSLCHPAHLVGIALMIGIFLAWLIPYRHDPATLEASQVWQHQMAGRLTGKFDFVGWITNIPRGLTDHLPWLLLVLVLWRKDIEGLGARNAAVFRAVRFGVLACFFGLLILPGILPRYTLPLLTPFSLLLATALADSRLTPPSGYLRAWWRANQVLSIVLLVAACVAPVVLTIVLSRTTHQLPSDRLGDFSESLVWPLLGSGGAAILCLVVFVGRMRLARPALIATASGALVAAGMFVFNSSALPILKQHDSLRPMAQTIDEAIPAGETLYICDSDYQPAVFYLRTPYRYVEEENDVPREARWVLARPDRGRHSLKDAWPDFEVESEFSPRSLQKAVLLRRKS